MASPFSMGLNGLVTRNIACYVKKFQVYGEWKEHELHECSKAGRVTDGSMMLNSLIRVAVEKMAVLEDFRHAVSKFDRKLPLIRVRSWELNTKMLPCLWQGLALKPTLAHLTIRFPSSKHPRPITLVPPLPNLISLKIYDIDPLCYADDVSLLILNAHRLEDLKLIWSPRMREAREPSISLDAFFGRLIAANRQLSLRSLAIKNLYTHNDDACQKMFARTALEEITYINSVRGSREESETVFLEPRLRMSDVNPVPSLKMVRIDKVSRQQLDFLGAFKGLERLYLVGPQSPSKGQYGGINSVSQTPFPNSPASSTNSPINDSGLPGLKDEYLNAITKNHGKTLRHLLLMPHWRLSSDDIALIVRHCPNLEQLGVGVEFNNFLNMRLLVPFLSKLTALRVLDNPDDTAFSQKMKELDDSRRHEEKIGNDPKGAEWILRWMGLGDLLFEIGRPRDSMSADEGNEENRYRRPVWKRPLSAANHIEIFGLDSLDI